MLADLLNNPPGWTFRVSVPFPTKVIN